LVATFIPLAFVFSPLLHDGFFPTMDDVQVVRIEEMYKELASGQFPARMVSDLGNGAGYMLFQFYSPLVYYIGALLYFLGFTLVISTKLTFLSGFILAWIGIVLLLREYVDEYSTFFGAILFFSSSYLGYDIYHRGALAEFYNLAILPLLFFTIVKLSQTSSKLYFLASSLTIAALILIHNLTALITFPFLLITVLLLFKKNLIYGLGSLFLGVTLSAFYWLPVALEQKFIIVGQVDFVINSYKSNFLSLPQLIGFQKAPWGFIAPMLGVSLFIGSLSSVLLLLVNRKLHFAKKLPSNFLVFSVISFFITLFMASSTGKIAWDPILPILRFVQFPWRFLTLATFFGAISCAFFLSQIKLLPLKIFLGVLLLIPLFTVQYNYLRPTEYNYVSKYTADDPCGTTGWGSEFLPIWAKECHPKGSRLEPINIIDGEIEIKNLEIKDHTRLYNFLATGEGTIFFDKYYFPGWQITIDNRPYPLLISNPHGYIAVNVPKGEHQVSLFFSNTPARIIANTITISGILVSLFIFFNYTWSNYKKCRIINRYLP